MIRRPYNINFLLNFSFRNFSFIYKNVKSIFSTRYYQKMKKSFKKVSLKDIKIFLKKRKSKSEDMVANNLRISQKMENKSYNFGHNILELCNVVVQIRFTKSKTKRDI